MEPKRFRFTPGGVWRTVDRTRSLALWDEIAASAAPDDVLQFTFVRERIWVLTDPDWCRRALVAPPTQVTRSSTFARIALFIGHSLLTIDGAEHRLRRRQLQPAFTRRRLASYATSMVAAAQRTGAAWRAGQRIEMTREMAALTMDAIGSAVLGVDGRAVAPEVGLALDRLMRATVLLLVPGLERIVLKPVPAFGWLRDANDVLDRTARRAAAGSQAELITALRSPDDDFPPMTAQQLRDELLTLLLAGHETTAVLLTWTWWFLDRNPAVADRMRAEIGSVLGGRAPSYDDVARLPFVQAVVAEVLRLRPPAWMLERAVAGPIDFGPYRPPPDTLLLVSPWLIHRDRRWWGPDAAEFRPGRWLDADGDYAEHAPGQPRAAYLPFGAGPHQCIGSAFAWTEAVLALAVLVPSWRPALVAGTEVGTRAAITLRPSGAVPMVLAPA